MVGQNILTLIEENTERAQEIKRAQREKETKTPSQIQGSGIGRKALARNGGEEGTGDWERGKQRPAWDAGTTMEGASSTQKRCLAGSSST